MNMVGVIAEICLCHTVRGGVIQVGYVDFDMRGLKLFTLKIPPPSELGTRFALRCQAEGEMLF